MFGILRFKRKVASATRELRNLKGDLVTFSKGEVINILLLESKDSQFFGIQNQTKGTAVLPPSLFNNNFLMFEKEV